MMQPDLFTGPQLRDEGITAAQQDRELACQAVDTAIRICAYGTDDGFTAEDVRDYLGRYVRDLPEVSKVIGGRIRAAALAGLIHTTGDTVTAKRPDAHARRMLIWRRTAGLLEVLA